MKTEKQIKAAIEEICLIDLFGEYEFLNESFDGEYDSFQRGMIEALQWVIGEIKDKDFDPFVTIDAVEEDYAEQESKNEKDFKQLLKEKKEKAKQRRSS